MRQGKVPRACGVARASGATRLHQDIGSLALGARPGIGAAPSYTGYILIEEKS